MSAGRFSVCDSWDKFSQVLFFLAKLTSVAAFFPELDAKHGCCQLSTCLLRTAWSSSPPSAKWCAAHSMVLVCVFKWHAISQKLSSFSYAQERVLLVEEGIFLNSILLVKEIEHLEFLMFDLSLKNELFSDLQNQSLLKKHVEITSYSLCLM